MRWLAWWMRGAMNVVCLDFSKAFDIVSHNLHIGTLTKYGLAKWNSEVDWKLAELLVSEVLWSVEQRPSQGQSLICGVPQYWGQYCSLMTCVRNRVRIKQAGRRYKTEGSGWYTRGTFTGWRIGTTGMSWSSATRNEKSCPWGRKFMLGPDCLESSFSEKDLWMLVGKLAMSQQSTPAAKKGSSILGYIKRVDHSLLLSTSESVSRVVCPVPGSPVQRDVGIQKQVHWRTAKMIKGLEHWSSQHRRGWESWVSLAWRTEGSGESYQCLQTPVEQEWRIWSQGLLSGAWWKDEKQWHKVKYRKSTQT